MNNFPIKLGGEEYWISRSIKIRVILVDESLTSIFAIRDDIMYFAEEYLNYDETIRDTCQRVTLDKYSYFVSRNNNFNLLTIEDDYLKEKQDVVLNYYIPVKNYRPPIFSNIVLIPITDLSKYEWKSNEKELIEKYLLEPVLD